jgi:LysM repeat protein
LYRQVIFTFVPVLHALRGGFIMLSRRPLLIALAFAILCSLLPVMVSAQSGVTYYTVQVGDELNEIAAAYGVSIFSLIQANSMVNPDRIYPGQRLIIPGGAAAATAGTATPVAPAAAAVATLPVATATAVPPTPVPTATPVPTLATVPSTYVVKAGDTLAKIADRFGTTIAALVEANNIANPNLVTIGSTLAMPGAGTSKSVAAAATPKPPATTKPAATAAEATGPRTDRITVSISKQWCELIINEETVGSWPCSTGRRGWETPAGTFKIQSKIPVAYGGTWDFYMPYWLGIYWSGGLENGFHGLPFNSDGFRDWGDRIGTPISFGCIVLQDDAAKTIYDNAYIGMPVIIEW